MESDNLRLDKWLWQARFYKTRSLATAAINGGKVHLNAERVKPAHRVRVGDSVSLSLQGIVAEFEVDRKSVRVGDSVSLSLQGIVAEFEVLVLPSRRGPAAEAQKCFLETPASAARRATLREQQRLAQVSRPRPASRRPDKRDRRRLLQLQREQLKF